MSKVLIPDKDHNFGYVEDGEKRIENTVIKEKEKNLIKKAEFYLGSNKPDCFKAILKEFESLLNLMPKAKVAKLIKKLISLSSEFGRPLEEQLLFCEESIAWCNREKRNFLRKRLETKKAEMLVKSARYRDAVSLLTRLAGEVKQIDDKPLLIEVCLLASRVQTLLNNVPVAKSFLQTARNATTSVYVAPELQARLDLQSGHVSLNEKNYKSSFGYYYESFEGFDGLKQKALALTALKYMFLSKMMEGRPAEIKNVLRGKIGANYDSEDLKAIISLAEAFKERCLRSFKDTLRRFEGPLRGDKIVWRCLREVEAGLLEQNIVRVIEPFSVVEISHIAKLVEIERDEIEAVLSKMVLDQKINGVIDQFEETLIILPENPKNSIYENVLRVINELELVVKNKSEQYLSALKQ